MKVLDLAPYIVNSDYTFISRNEWMHSFLETNERIISRNECVYCIFWTASLVTNIV